MKKIFAIISILAATAPAIAQNTRPLTARQIEAVRSSMAEMLLDAESARFKDVVAGHNINSEDRSSGIKDLCGKVNSKNLMGAYTGYQIFYGVWIEPEKGGDPFAIVMAAGEEQEALARTMCLKNLDYQ